LLRNEGSQDENRNEDAHEFYFAGAAARRNSLIA